MIQVELDELILSLEPFVRYVHQVVVRYVHILQGPVELERCVDDLNPIIHEH